MFLKLNISMNIRMDEKVAEELDNLVANIIAADENNEVDYICISKLSIQNGILNSNFTPIVSGKTIPSYELEEKFKFRNIVEYTRNDMLPSSAIILWHREGM